MTPHEATISVVIPTKNAAHLLRTCLPTVAWADEIIVVDMFSDDETAEVCAGFPQCRLLQRNGYILDNVNYGFDHATSAWTMRLDSDEHVTPELAAELRDRVRTADASITGFSCWERPVILGKELRYGWGRRHHRKMIFRRGMARYPEQHDHEDLVTSGTWVETTHGYLHYNYFQARQYLDKINYYTDNDVARLPLPAAPPPVRAAVIDGLRAFYLYYLKWRGYKDGWVGFYDATMRALYLVVRWAKIRERFDGGDARG